MVGEGLGLVRADAGAWQMTCKAAGVGFESWQKIHQIISVQIRRTLGSDGPTSDNFNFFP